jgi:hypothetical protein
MEHAWNGRGNAADLQRIWCAGKPDGQPCGGRAMRGSEFCFWHAPETEEERMNGRFGRQPPVGAPIVPEEMPLNTVADVQALLRQVAVYLATGERIEPRRATVTS